MSLSVSVIIPVWHEAASINERIRHIREREAASSIPVSVEIIVADGAPDATTVNAVEDASVITVVSKQGRGVQMNTGAAHATGDILLFLHADTELPHDAFMLIHNALKGKKNMKPCAKAGAFALSIASSSRFLYLVSVFGNWRNRLTKTPYGDQAQFFQRDYFESLGGYASIPIMEDVEIMRRIRDRSEPLAIITTPVVTSARRWEQEGVYRCTLRNLMLRSLYGAGVSARTLSHWYRAMKG